MKRPPIVRALQLIGCFCIAMFLGGTGFVSFPVVVMLGILWFLVIEISWETRFPW
jgi:hypothetical protein